MHRISLYMLSPSNHSGTLLQIAIIHILATCITLSLIFRSHICAGTWIDELILRFNIIVLLIAPTLDTANGRATYLEVNSGETRKYVWDNIGNS